MTRSTTGFRVGEAVERFVRERDRPPRLLAFGEPMHGEEEFLRLRNELFAHLVEHAGYGSIALESSCLHGRLVDHYVRTGDGDLDRVLREGFSHGFGDSPANRDLVRWLADHNRNAAEPVRFLGFDPPIEMMGADSPRAALSLVHSFLRSRVPDLPWSWERIDALLGDDARWSDPAAAMDPSRSVGGSSEARELRLIADDLRWLLAGEAPGLTDSPDELWEAELGVRTAAGLLAYHAGMAGDSPHRVARLLSIRDTMMADNLAALARRECRPALVFAHNQHLHRGATQWKLGELDLRWHAAGAIVTTGLGDEYAVIATAIGTASHHGIGTPEPDSIEGRLSTLPGSAHLVPTSELTGDRPRTSGNHGYFPLDPTALNFDAVLYVREISPNG